MLKSDPICLGGRGTGDALTLNRVHVRYVARLHDCSCGSAPVKVVVLGQHLSKFHMYEHKKNI